MRALPVHPLQEDTIMEWSFEYGGLKLADTEKGSPPDAAYEGAAPPTPKQPLSILERLVDVAPIIAVVSGLATLGYFLLK